ncbi:response regulator transcription factor [Clostridium fungisolvens]|uniref:Stage 0 sporulation protein A homolog n=1 Tax=Clostridium fungisolvens TaxID=1604897 RepID=A0A6V8SLY7_9CLOT|nr:response regulator [Clostridium fungisolvens]GFP76188.1 Protein-glutamate methylesterase/protein-glutamine glutaminase [Clostridium fungisolvens]
MFKLMIADDEARIRRGIRKAVAWEQFEIEVVGEAEDGEMALSLAQKTCPDIILLDICMPFLNGLELITKLKASDKECMIIIITGHDEFEYMQQAIKLKIFDYILKPVNKESLKDAIARAIEELKKVRDRRNYLDWVNKQFDNNINTLRHSFVNSWLSGNMPFEAVVNELKFLRINIDNNVGILIIKVLDRFNTEVVSKKWDNRLLSFAIINICYEVLGDFEPIFNYVDNEDNIMIVFNIDNPYEWINIGTSIEEKILKHLKFNILLEQRRISNGIVGIKQAYKSIVNVINEKAMLKPVVLLAIKYIEGNYFSNDLSLEVVAEQFNANPSYLSRIIKQETGSSFIDYLTNLRIKKAIFIMDDPTIKIYQVAEMVGYSNQHYFCKAFKKVMGISPTEYRGGSGIG